MPSRSTAIALLALFLAAGGTAVAAKRLIDGRTIEPRSITTSKLTRSAVRSLRRAAAQPVTGARIVDGTVTGADLAPGSVGNDQVVDRSLTAGRLVAETLTSGEIGVGAVGESELAPNSVGNSEIRPNSVSRNLLRANVLRVERVATDIGNVGPGACALGDVDEAAYQLPTGALENAVVEAELIGEAPAGLLVDARSPDGSDLVIQVCNLSNASTALAGRTFAIAVLGT